MAPVGTLQGGVPATDSRAGSERYLGRAEVAGKSAGGTHFSAGPTQAIRATLERTWIMAFRPLHDRVLVRRIEADEKTAGGIIIPDTAKEKPQEGEIVAVGTGNKADDGKVTPLDVKAGDRVLFGKWSGTEVKVDGEDLIIMKESDILGVIA